MREIRRRRRIGKVPALDIDGKLFVDSTSIAHELDRRHPSPPLFPDDSRERALCHALEDWADEPLYFHGLYHHWHERAGRRQVAAYFARTLLGRVAFFPYLALVERQLRGEGTGRATAWRSVAFVSRRDAGGSKSPRNGVQRVDRRIQV